MVMMFLTRCGSDAACLCLRDNTTPFSSLGLMSSSETPIDYSLEFERDADGNPIGDQFTGFKMIARARACREQVSRSCYYHRCTSLHWPDVHSPRVSSKPRNTEHLLPNFRMTATSAETRMPISCTLVLHSASNRSCAAPKNTISS